MATDQRGQPKAKSALLLFPGRGGGTGREKQAGESDGGRERETYHADAGDPADAHQSG